MSLKPLSIRSACTPLPNVSPAVPRHAHPPQFDNHGTAIRSVTTCGPTGAQTELFDITFLWSNWDVLEDGSVVGRAIEVFVASAANSTAPNPDFLAVSVNVSADGNHFEAVVPMFGTPFKYTRMPASAFPLAAQMPYVGMTYPTGTGPSNPSATAVQLVVDGPLATSALPGPQTVYQLLQQWMPSEHAVKHTFLSGNVPAGTVQWCSYTDSDGQFTLVCCAPGACTAPPSSSDDNTSTTTFKPLL